MKMCRITEVQEACRTFDVSVKKNCIKSETNFLNLSCMMRASGNSIFFPVYMYWISMLPRERSKDHAYDRDH